MTRQRQSLRQSAALRIGAALLAVALVAAAASAVVFQTLLERSSRTHSESAVRDYGEKLREIGRSWDEFLTREKRRLEYTRLLEDPRGRWDRLRVLLNTLTDTPQFAGLTVCGPDDRELFRHGPEVGCAHAAFGIAKSYHYFLDATGGLFVALDAPLWLGPEGTGHMRLVVPLDHGFLWRNAFAGTDLFIVSNGRIVASSAGERGLAVQIHPDGTRFKRDGSYYVQHRLGMPGKEPLPQLLIQTRIDLPLTPGEIAAVGLGIFVLLDLMLVFLLHGWLARLLPRIESLGHASMLFKRDERMSTEIAAQLDIAAGRHDDELTDAANAARDMVTALAEREQARLAEEERRRRDEERLRLSERVFANSAQAIIITDAMARIVSVNPAFTAITGYAADEVIGDNPHMLASGRHDDTFYAAMWSALMHGGFWSGELWDRRKNGEVYPIWIAISAVRDGNIDATTHYVGIFSDITEQKQNAQRIEQLAFRDTLTDLPNRASLHEMLTQAVGLAQRGERQMALMLIDLDNFKIINDTLGHQTGDQLLVQVAQRLQASVRQSDFVARLGGDEFVVVLPEINSLTSAAHVAEKILTLVSEPYQFDGLELRTSPSIGISIYPNDAENANDLMRNADMAMYHAKSAGRADYHFFTTEMQVAAVNRLAIEADLRKAIANDEFELHYQPQLDLRSGQVVGVEALIRWRHPSRGLVPPLEFIPVAESSGLIAPIGDWVLRDACRQLAAWKAAGLGHISMSVNLSASQFADPALPKRIHELTTAAGVDAGRLELEITESMAMTSPADAIGTMQVLAKQGLSLSIDDFGTGYSSLAYLKLFPIDTLKIDRSFVKDIETDPNDADICDVTVLLAHRLGLTVIAEGVENMAQFKYLLSIGCEKIQGYLISKPLPADAAETYIRNAKPLAELGTVHLWDDA